MRPGECQLSENYASERSLSEEARTIELETSILLARARKLVRKCHFENQLTAKLFLSSEKGSSTFGGTFFGKAITITPNNTTGPSTSPSTASGGQTSSVFGALSSRVGLANTLNTASTGSQTGSAFGQGASSFGVPLILRRTELKPILPLVLTFSVVLVALPLVEVRQAPLPLATAILERALTMNLIQR
ncbi:hypothetical protein H2248_012476 [Termitomyces sp. 'cryptogamus']|nr:hypothetical protein H2248_012476 [Termitomyces sp. 'cryptogamus']